MSVDEFVSDEFVTDDVSVDEFVSDESVTDDVSVDEFVSDEFVTDDVSVVRSVPVDGELVGVEFVENFMRTGISPMAID